jgi:hypothetical protein
MRLQVPGSPFRVALLRLTLTNPEALMKLHGMTTDEWWMSLRSVFFKQTEYIYSTFDVGRSMFDVYQFLFRSDWPFFAQRLG